MENYARRSKSILSLIIFSIILYGCCTKYKSQILPPTISVVMIGDSLGRYNEKNLIVTLVKDYNPIDSNESKYSEKIYNDNVDSLVNIKTGEKISKKDNYFVISFNDFKIDYKIVKGQLIEKQNNVKTIIDYLRIEDGDYLKILSLQEGDLECVDLAKFGGPLDTEGYCYNKEGDIDFLYDNYSDLYIKKGNDTTKYAKLDYTYYPLKKYFYSGSGIWKMYHYENTNPSYILDYNKEEGEVKNNFKYGEWKYYNKNGSINSTKTYALKDSVDVRFPHCIFNKKEPCYCEKI